MVKSFRKLHHTDIIQCYSIYYVGIWCKFQVSADVFIFQFIKIVGSFPLDLIVLLENSSLSVTISLKYTNKNEYSINQIFIPKHRLP